MAKLNGSDLFIKTAAGYVSLGRVKIGKIILDNNHVYEIGSVEELFDLELLPEDKLLLKEMQIR